MSRESIMPTELKIRLESPEMAVIIIGVVEELRKAEKKHPDWSGYDLFGQVCIMQEEAGEVSKAVIDFHNGSGTIQEFKVELMQTAAMCMRILKNLEDEKT